MNRPWSALVAACALLYGLGTSHPAPLHAQQAGAGSPTETETIEAFRYGLLQRLVVANKMIFGNRDYEDLTVLFAYRTSMFNSESLDSEWDLSDPEIKTRILRPSGREGGFLTATPYEVIEPEDYCEGCKNVLDILNSNSINSDKTVRSDMFFAFEKEVSELDYSGLFIVDDSQ